MTEDQKDPFKNYITLNINDLYSGQIYTSPSKTTSISTNFPSSYNYTYDIGRHYGILPIHQKSLEVEISPGFYKTISREELVKYISERSLIEENQVVRKMYERYQVALKLARSEDDDQRGK